MFLICLFIYIHIINNYDLKKGLCPNSESVFENMITLPCHPLLKEDELKYIRIKVNEICQ